jgi:hypothetical protein
MATPVLALVAALFAPAALAFETKKASVMETVTAPEVASVLQTKGHETTEKVDNQGDPLLGVKAEAFNYQVLFYNCTEGRCDTVQYRAWWTLEKKFPLDVVNEFNKTNRLGRAYLDQDGDPTLELVIEMHGGVTPEQMSYQHDRFMRAGAVFKSHLSKALETK